MSESSDSTTVKGRKYLVFALCVAIAAIGVAVGAMVYTWRLSEQVQANAGSVVRGDGHLEQLAAQVRQLREQQAGLLSVKAELEAYRAQFVAQLDKLSGVYQDEWLIEEAANYVRMAEQRLILGRDPAGAVAFLAAADEVLARVALVGTDEARLALANDSLELSRASLDNAGRERAMFMVDTLMQRAGDLAMKPQQWEWTYGTQNYGADVDVSSGSTSSSGIMAGVRGFFYSLVTVRRHAPGRPLVAEPQMRIYFEQNYRMLLQYLMFNALKNDGEAFKRGIERTEDWLGDFFDPKDRMVSAALSQLRSMKDFEWESMPVNLNRSRHAIAALHQSWKQSTTSPPREGDYEEGGQ